MLEILQLWLHRYYWLKLMEPKSTIITRTRNMALLVTRLYHIVKWQKFFLMLGRRITYVNITEEDARKAMKKMGMEEWLIDALIEFYNVIKSGDASQSTAVVEQITGRKPISFEQFVRDYSSSFN